MFIVAPVGSGKGALVALVHRPESINSTVYRAGLMVYRIAMILTVLRRYEAPDTMSTMVCSDTGFGMALDLSEVLPGHALLMPATMPQDERAGRSSEQSQLYRELPEHFSQAQADEVAASLSIKTRSVTNYLAQR